MENHFGKYLSKGDRLDVAIPVKYHELELSSLKRGTFLHVGMQGKLENLFALGKKRFFGKVLPQGSDIAIS